jgi:hypothetical protein
MKNAINSSISAVMMFLESEIRHGGFDEGSTA